MTVSFPVIDKKTIFAKKPLNIYDYDTDDIEHRESGHYSKSAESVGTVERGFLKGVSVVQTSRTKTAKSEKEEILQDIREAYTEVLEAQKTGKELPRLEDLLKEYEVE